jgi:hypothetical protein
VLYLIRVTEPADCSEAEPADRAPGAGDRR